MFDGTIDYWKYDEYVSAATVAMHREIETEVVGKLMEVTQKYAIVVDEGRLLEILRNDRASYYKGRRDAESQIANSKRITLNGFNYIQCGCCGKLTLDSGEEFVRCVYCHMIGNTEQC